MLLEIIELNLWALVGSFMLLCFSSKVLVVIACNFVVLSVYVLGGCYS